MEQLPLVGLIEIAQRAGVKRPVVTMWRKRHADFPVPVADLHIGPIFWWPLVEVWLRASGRQSDADWSIEQVATWGSTTNTKAARDRVVAAMHEEVARFAANNDVPDPGPQ